MPAADSSSAGSAGRGAPPPPPPPADEHFAGEKRARAEIDHAPRQRFVERRVGGRESRDAVTLAERLRQRLAQHDPRILDQVMRVALDIPCAAELQVESAVPRDL